MTYRLFFNKYWGDRISSLVACHRLLIILTFFLTGFLPMSHLHSKNKKYFQAPFFGASVCHNRGLVSVPGRTIIGILSEIRRINNIPIEVFPGTGWSFQVLVGPSMYMVGPSRYSYL